MSKFIDPFEFEIHTVEYSKVDLDLVVRIYIKIVSKRVHIVFFTFKLEPGSNSRLIFLFTYLKKKLHYHKDV